MRCAKPGAGSVKVRDAVGNLLADGDQVTLIKDLKVKGAGQTLKRGTLIKSIRLTGDEQEIDCRLRGSRGWCCARSCAEAVEKRQAADDGAAHPVGVNIGSRPHSARCLSSPKSNGAHHDWNHEDVRPSWPKR
jgi:uncharacterized Zn ribbon protein